MLLADLATEFTLDLCLHRYQKSHGHLVFLDFKVNLSQHQCHQGGVHTLRTKGSKHKKQLHKLMTSTRWHKKKSLMKRKQSQNYMIGEVRKTNCSQCQRRTP